jgi:hypothetical protein
MRRISSKRQARQAEAKPFRDDLIQRVGRCEYCHEKPPRVRLCVHEVANGPNRQKALDKPYAVLVLCWGCNGLATDKGTWSEAAQLKCLKESRPEDYDLAAYNHLINPRAPMRIEQFEVDSA